MTQTIIAVLIANSITILALMLIQSVLVSLAVSRIKRAEVRMNSIDHRFEELKKRAEEMSRFSDTH